jgi:DNA-directed RNA polymerase specialized sigma24 family protein
MPRPERQIQGYDAGKSGAEGYLEMMAVFPTLTDRQTHVALNAKYAGIPLKALQKHPAFQPLLDQERETLTQQTAAGIIAQPRNSFTELFAQSEGSIDLFIGLGHYRYIFGIGRHCNNVGLPFSVEEYCNDMIYREMSKIIQGYGEQRIPFKSFLTRRLKERAIDRVRRTRNAITSPNLAVFGKQGHEDEGRAQSRPIMSIEALQLEEEIAGGETFAYGEATGALENITEMAAQENKLFIRSGVNDRQRTLLLLLAELETPGEVLRELGGDPTDEQQIKRLYSEIHSARQRFRRNVNPATAHKILNGDL